MEKKAMKRAEILELLKLRRWSQAELARQLHLSEAAVSRWLSGDSAGRTPGGPATMLMRQWLAEAGQRSRGPG